MATLSRKPAEGKVNSYVGWVGLSKAKPNKLIFQKQVKDMSI